MVSRVGSPTAYRHSRSPDSSGSTFRHSTRRALVRDAGCAHSTELRLESVHMLEQFAHLIDHLRECGDRTDASPIWFEEGGPIGITSNYTSSTIPQLLSRLPQ